MISILDLFRPGIGPSSSHTVGPIRIANQFIAKLLKQNRLFNVDHIDVILQGSLALTGQGHDTPKACILGLWGWNPSTIDIDRAEHEFATTTTEKLISLNHTHTITFDPATNIVFDYDTVPDLHPNGMVLRAYEVSGNLITEETYYSVGGGFIATAAQLKTPARNDKVSSGYAAPFEFLSAERLLELCQQHNTSIADIVLRNEDAIRPRDDTNSELDRIADIMMKCIDRGLQTDGFLPGPMQVRRRAAKLWSKLSGQPMANERESLFDWLNVYAIAVNEENAAGGRVVTAPTNGAAGIIPAILRYYCQDQERPESELRTFLLTAGAIGLLYKQRASISGAEMGCQGEVGVACSMAAAGLAAIWGGTPLQIAAAAEIGMEHNLGLTCDPVGGQVQIPCIERNAIGAVKAANAARLALQSDGNTHVTLDQVIETMRQTGEDMSTKYKETSQGGLAVNVVEC